MNTLIRKVIGITLCVIAYMALGGCSRGPEPGGLQQDVQMRLDNTFGSGLLKINSFRRYGSQPLPAMDEDSRQRLAVYFKADIELLRAHRFSDWSGQNTATLLQVLGSAKRGVTGVFDKGNQAGDIISAHGLSVYVASEDSWSMISFATDNTAELSQTTSGLVSEIDAGTSRPQITSTSWQQNISEQLTVLQNALEMQQMSAQSSALRTDIQSALTRAQLELLKQSSKPALLSGAEAGDYHVLARGLKKTLASVAPSFAGQLTAVTSTGAIDNLSLLDKGLASYAITQSDLALAAYSGNGVFAGKANTNLRAIASLYLEPIQIVVHRKSSIRSLADLAGKQVNLGPEGSGTQVNARQILRLANISDQKFSNMDIGASITELMAGKLDAVFITGASPSSYLNQADGNIDLLSLDKTIVDTLTKEFGYLPYQIQPGTYSELKNVITTVAVTAVLVVNKTAAGSEVTAILDSLFDVSTEQGEYGERGASLNRSRALEGIAIPLHSAAKGYFKLE